MSDTLIGIITRYNKKTVSVITEQGYRWNVSPGLLILVKNARKINSADVFNFRES
jgi:hypothetical protein